MLPSWDLDRNKTNEKNSFNRFRYRTAVPRNFIPGFLTLPENQKNIKPQLLTLTDKRIKPLEAVPKSDILEQPPLVKNYFQKIFDFIKAKYRPVPYKGYG
jgi:hypothetical protein